MIRAECEKCGKVVNVPETYAGGEGKCKRCGWRVYIPEPGQQRANSPAIDMSDSTGADALSAIASATDLPPRAPGETGDPPRRRRRRNSNTGIIVAAWMIAFFLLVIIGVVIYAANWHEEEIRNPTNVEVIPAKPR